MSSPPDFIEKKPIPQIVSRLYRGQNISMWVGKVAISKITGWAENPRIEFARRKWERNFSGIQLGQDEVYEIMKNEPQVDLKKLQVDICKNGLREPIVLTWGGRLLDGNRRFFAIRLALEILPQGHPTRSDLKLVNVFVLMEDATDKDEERILVEENFAPSLKKEWPHYVKAIKIREAKEKGMDKDEISASFGWPTNKIRETERTLEIIDDYKTYALDNPNPEDETGGGLGLEEDEVEKEISDMYQFFNEAQKSFFDPLQKEVEFKLSFFKWLHNKKFKSFNQVRIACKAWGNSEAKKILDDKSSDDAGKRAKTIVDAAEDAERNKQHVYTETKKFLGLLSDLTLENINELESKTLNELREILKKLEIFLQMVERASEKSKLD